MGFSVLVVAALAILCTSIGRIDGARLLTQATPATAKPSVADCTFTDSASGLLTRDFVEAFGFLMVTPAGAMRCFNTIELDYGFVHQGLYGLADIMEDTYVYVALAADPSGTNQTNPYGFKVYPDKVDIPKELRGMADAWPTNMSVPLGDVHFAVGDVFNRLRDAHVVYNGAGTTFGGVIQALSLGGKAGGARAYLVDSTTSSMVTQIGITPSDNGTLTYQLVYLKAGRRINEAMAIKSINGSDPMDAIIALANNPALSLPYKHLGVRINDMISNMNNLQVTEMGYLSLLESFTVEYVNGTTTTLNWGIAMAPSIDAETLANYTAKANMPGVPFMALMKALQTYTDETADTVTSVGPAPPLQGPPMNRRALQGVTADTGMVYIRNSKLEYGSYYYNGTRAMLKLTTFQFTPDDLASWWPRFVDAAKQQGATELVLDVTTNGGGIVVTGAALALALYPSTNYSSLGMQYDRIIGPSAAYAYSNGLKPAALNATYSALCNNSTWLQARTDAINSNATEFARLSNITRATFDAITTLFNASFENQTQACNTLTNQTIKCSDLWNLLAGDGLVDDDLTAEQITIQWLSEFLTESMILLERSFWPYDGAFNSTGDDQYTDPEMYRRGGYTRNYTSKYGMLEPDMTAREAFPNWVGFSATPPFSKILAVGDGFCGSTCDQFSKAAWFYSKQNPTAPKFKYATFGGTGKINDSACSSFPGGNVNDDDLLTQAWAYFAIADLQAEWSGEQVMMDKSDAFGESLPVFPSFLDSTTPRYTQSEMYFEVLGPDALPTEFYLMPPDYQINAWYKDTNIPQAGGTTDLYDLYHEADKILATM